MSRLSRLGLVALLASLPLAATVLPAAPRAQAQNSSAVTQEKVITNHGKGETSVASVSVSTTRNLVDRQQVAIDLAGFKASYNTNNTAAYGTRIEYPVVVMQCRGTNPDRRHCINEERVVWHGGFDRDAPEEQRVVAQTQSSPGDTTPYPPQDDVYDLLATVARKERLPFTAANGVSYLWSTQNRPDGSPLIDEPKLKSFKPTDVSGEGSAMVNTRNLPVKPDGTNEFLFEVRQNASQPSLGCTDRQDCSIVVVPVMDMACVEDAPAACTSGPAGPGPGSPDGGTDSYNRFVASQQWLAQSNWENRIVVPIGFAPDLQSCDVRDNRPTIPAFGSELVSVAQERWGAAYCTGVRPSDYLPVFSQGSEYFGRRQFTSKLGTKYLQDAVFVSQPVTDSPRPVAHAPNAITGFTVAFVVDDGNSAQAQHMTLSARLLAKLLTQSYNPLVVPPAVRQGKTPYDGTQKITSDAEAGNYYVAHPALMNNPASLFADPEFAKLNPDFVLKQGEDAIAPHLTQTINPMVFTVESDIIMDVTRYVTSDTAARTWLDGYPDEYGMRVNPAWARMQPSQLYSLLDTWQRTAQPRKAGWIESDDADPRYFVIGGGGSCDEMHKTPYLTRLSNVANSAKASAQLLLDRRGSATPICTRTEQAIPEKDQADEPQFPGDDVTQDVRYTESKAVPSEFGRRAQLALTTVPLARLYALPTAKLVNAGGKAVAPTPGTMVSALRAADLDHESGTLQIDHTRVTAGNAYPGTMVSYLAAPTAGLAPAAAARYADYIEFMATTGQKPGQTLASLPSGYDPLPPALVQQALNAAQAVREQKGEVPGLSDGGPLGDDPGAGMGLPPLGDTPGNGLVAPQGAGPDDVDADPATVAKTEGTSSWLARWAIPLMIAFGLLAGLVAFVVQVGSQPGHPLRRKLDELLRAVRLR